LPKLKKNDAKNGYSPRPITHEVSVPEWIFMDGNALTCEQRRLLELLKYQIYLFGRWKKFNSKLECDFLKIKTGYSL
jgi:hypothetical protein